MLKRVPICLLAVLSFSAIGAQTTPSVQEVYKIFQAKCQSCHDNASPEGGLDLEGVGSTDLLKAVNVASKLTNVNPTNTFAAGQGLKRVYPGRPDRSFLFKKINKGLEPTLSALHANEGATMPRNGNLTDAEKEVIRQWILFGAKTSGVLFDKAVIDDYYAGNGEKAFPDGPPPAPAAGEGFQIKMGPFFLKPDGEAEYFQKYELNMPANIEVNRLELLMSGYSHHLIVYNFLTSNAANLVSHGLRPNPNHNAINIVAAVQEQTDLRLPATTAFKWDKNIILDLNSHYINYSLTKNYLCEAYVNVYTQPAGTAKQQMFATLMVNSNIPIPNNGNPVSYTKAEFQSTAGNIYVWGVMGHTHKYGTGYKVWKRQPNGAKGDLMYDASCPGGIPGCPTPYFDYRHIPLRYWEPSLQVNWANGIIHEANWVNDGPAAVNFGPTSDDEMMVLIAFYTQAPIAVDTDEDIAAAPAQVTPNPTTGNVRFSIPGKQEIRALQLFDYTGREVLRRERAPGDFIEVDLSHLPAGVYFYHIDGRAGKVAKL